MSQNTHAPIKIERSLLPTVIYSTDTWGNVPCAHVELQVKGLNVYVNVDQDGRIEIISESALEIEQTRTANKVIVRMV